MMTREVKMSSKLPCFLYATSKNRPPKPQQQANSRSFSRAAEPQAAATANGTEPAGSGDPAGAPRSRHEGKAGKSIQARRMGQGLRQKTVLASFQRDNVV